MFNGCVVYYDMDFTFFVKSPDNTYEYSGYVEDYYVLNGKDHFLRDSESKWARPTPTPTPTPKKSRSSGKKKKTNHNAYDEGYEDIYFDEDYDWDRYWRDKDYADGVDDAMEDVDW